MSKTMDTDNNEKEKGQEQPFSAETIPDQISFPAPPTALHPKHRRWLVVIISTVVIVLLLTASVSAVVLMQGGRRPVTVTPTPHPTTTAPNPTATTTAPTTATPPPPRGQWVQVLSDYRVTSLAAAPSHPNVLYACSIPPGLPDNMAGVQTVLRSEDFGTNWQDIGIHAGMSRGCELTINPTNSNEIYVSTSSNAPENAEVPSFVLKHTTNGGASWETLQPTMHGLGLQTTPAWQGTHLSFVGNHLYSLQELPIPPQQPTPTAHQGPLPTTWTRLLMSTDGGKTWGVLDKQFYTTWQRVWGYRVNPVDASTIYELVSLPGETPGGPMQAELYKSVDGGTTWQALLKQIPSSPTTEDVYLGSNNPNLVYIRAQCPSAQASQTRSGTGSLAVYAGGIFNLCTSRDAGATWQTIAAPQELSRSMSGGLIDAQGRFYTFTLFSTPTEIWRYDPASNAWSKLAAEPIEGTFMQVTLDSGSGDVALWLLGSAQGKYTLYRYEV